MKVSNIILKTTLLGTAISKEIARELIEKKIAACVSLHPKTLSFFSWKNKVVCDEEIELEIKTRSDKIKEIENLIQKKSAYKCPQIIVIPIKYMSTKYQSWFLDQIE